MNECDSDVLFFSFLSFYKYKCPHRQIDFLLAVPEHADRYASMANPNVRRCLWVVVDC